MCGRFAQTVPLGKLTKINLYDQLESVYSESYNLAPSQSAFSVIMINEKKIMKPMRWGLIPSWSKAEKPVSGLINARIESLTEKPSFKNSYKTRRCIIPVSGFYEWKKNGKIRKPYFINCGSDGEGDFIPMLMCGIYDSWIPADGEPAETFTIITTEAAAGMKTIHQRMPLIIEHKNILLWLGKDYRHEEHLELIKSFNSGSLNIRPVTDFVNSYLNNTPQCILPSGD